jgi:hypothetical protein
MATPDPDFPKGWNCVTTPPSEVELRDIRRIVTERLGGTVYIDQHAGRKTSIKQAPGRFKRVLVDLANCERDHVIADVPTNENEHDPDARNMRICLVCDAGRELLGYRP